MENPLSVANYFIKKSFEGGKDLTPMKLLKLVYIAHGWHLGLTNEPLIGEQVEAWKYGPVIPSLYHKFKIYGNEKIGRLGYILTEEGQLVAPIADGEIKPFLNQIWEVYKNFSGLQLSTLTHQEGTPWDIVWNKENGKELQGAVIRNPLIEEHYKLKQQNAAA